jgi:hypothetical protein
VFFLISQGIKNKTKGAAMIIAALIKQMTGIAYVYFLVNFLAHFK